jgi:hypothetical protein
MQRVETLHDARSASGTGRGRYQKIFLSIAFGYIALSLA